MVMHEPVETVSNDEFDVEHNVIHCRRCKRLLDVDATLEAPAVYGECKPVDPTKKVTRLIM